ncbi:hypothetical protein [Petrimonas mucosa]|uniref:Lipoprotein n=1 Tax=Petrimonas mucosa TaxID=1642646 RepID=A0A1G4G8X0_9BACT|nr:hypothetical protein [Petrimonas mucosa]SCM58958.1 putative protein {ECO:0000313/EMBL:CEA16250,1} [Petrimonas mucosa]
MKTLNYLIIIALSVLTLSSCKTTYYQVYRAVPSDRSMANREALVYEDENCEVTYNLWSHGGNMGFAFFNKSKENIYLNLDECFFVRNNVANDYYLDREFTQTSNVGSKSSRKKGASVALTGLNFLGLIQSNQAAAEVSESLITSSGSSISVKEKKIITIPPGTLKFISEYNISESLYRDCDLLKYPRRKQVKTLHFMKEESPFVFSNRITYRVGESAEPVQFENQFYVSEITNYPEKEVVDYESDEFCGEKSEEKYNFFKIKSPDRFYIMYLKSQNGMKH